MTDKQIMQKVEQMNRATLRYGFDHGELLYYSSLASEIKQDRSELAQVVLDNEISRAIERHRKQKEAR